MAMYPYRVFICYAHEDADLVCRIDQALTDLGLRPTYDKSIDPGTSFTEDIKRKITHAHLFVPVLTEHTQRERPWVHQETGYAVALNVPVLPIAVEGSLPTGVISQLQAITIPAEADVELIVERLRRGRIEQRVSSISKNFRDMVEIAEWIEDRTRMLGAYSRWVMEEERGESTGLRQRGALSSFCLPNAPPGDPIWARRDGELKRPPSLHPLQAEERKALEAHARNGRCDLIVDPTIPYKGHGMAARKVRLEILRDALRSMQEDGINVRIVTSEMARGGNLTIVGDWFVAESIVPRPDGYRQTIFKWHGPTVLEAIRQFDDQFEYLCKQAKLEGSGVLGPEPDKAMKLLDEIIATLPE